jgi:F-box and leucine-rich repeat protein GRR1
MRCICHGVSTTSDLLTCMFVSRSWAKHAVSILWRKPIIHSTDALKTLAAYLSAKETTFIYPSFVRSFDVPEAIRGNISNDDILPFAECNNILSLGLAGCPLSGDAVVRILLDNRRIKSINVSSISMMTDQGISDIVSACRYLEAIDISGCPQITSRSATSILTMLRSSTSRN